MSLSKKLCVRSDPINRQSFSDRICDDLSKVILQYLSLEDRLRLECVSKQFQRTVFVKQREINYEKHILNDNKGRQRSEKKQILLIETIVKKCRNITKFFGHCFGVGFGEQKYNQIFDLIIKNYNNLTHLDVDFGLLSENNQKIIHEKYGSKLMITHSRNLSKSIFKTLSVNKVHSSITDWTELKFNSLNRLYIINNEENLDHLKVLIEENKHLVKYLYLFCKKFDDNFIPKFKNLVHLNVCYLFVGLTDNQFKRIADNCCQLKSIKCRLSIDPNSGPINDSLLSSLKQIKSLKRLNILIDGRNENQIFKDYIKSFSFKAFKGFEGLTHLTIGWFFPKSVITSETILTDIDINLPNLQILRILTNIRNVSEWTADILCRLTKLQTIEIPIEMSVQPIIKRRFEESIKIKNIEFQENNIHWKSD